jgi:glycosyltransferase involved in cell wall biosynthesis
MVSSFWVGLRVKGVDLVWGTSPPIFQGLTAWALARLKRVPLLFEVRDLWPAFAVAVGVLENKALIRASEWLEGFLYRGADLLVVNSPGFITHVETRAGVPVQLVPNGADVEMFDPDNTGERFRRQHGLARQFVALYAGAHGMSNDLEVVLGAADQLRDLDDLVFVLLGDGKEKPNLRARADALDLGNVRFLPSVPKYEMSDAVAAADACIAILKPIEMYKTVYPNKVFDYMAAGRPVLLAIDGVIREVVETAQAGVFVPPGDPQSLAGAIQSLYQDRQGARLLGENGRRYVATHFDRTALAEQLLDIITTLVNSQ